MIRSRLHELKSYKFVTDIALSVVKVIASFFGLAMPICGFAWLLGCDLKLTDFGKPRK